MNRPIEKTAKWFYRGVWGMLAEYFKVPEEPPKLPVHHDEEVESFHPADGFLRYLKLHFWILLTLIDVAVLIAWIVIVIASPIAGAITAAPAFLIAVVPDILAFLAIHLRYDTTWYVMSQRSLRIRRGIWIIHETTITFENVQNVNVTQGPIQRLFGIANVLVETAGGGGSEEGQSSSTSAHSGLIEGVADAHSIRDKILNRLKRSRTAGLGDEDLAAHRAPPTPTWTTKHIEVLREIRDAAKALG